MASLSHEKGIYKKQRSYMEPKAKSHTMCKAAHDQLGLCALAPHERHSQTAFHFAKCVGH